MIEQHHGVPILSGSTARARTGRILNAGRVLHDDARERERIGVADTVRRTNEPAVGGRSVVVHDRNQGYDAVIHTLRNHSTRARCERNGTRTDLGKRRVVFKVPCHARVDTDPISRDRGTHAFLRRLSENGLDGEVAARLEDADDYQEKDQRYHCDFDHRGTACGLGSYGSPAKHESFLVLVSNQS